MRDHWRRFTVAATAALAVYGVVVADALARMR